MEKVVITKTEVANSRNASDIDNYEYAKVSYLVDDEVLSKSEELLNLHPRPANARKQPSTQQMRRRSPVPILIPPQKLYQYWAENYGGDLNEGSSRVSYGRLRGKTNAICPPPSDRRLPTVKWEDPEDIKEYFPKTHSMICAEIRNSTQYLMLTKWEKERSFFTRKLDDWNKLLISGHLIEKERKRARQLVRMLQWLLDNCWDGDKSKPIPPEMLWRARKEEMRRVEQLLVRKSQLMKTVQKPIRNNYPFHIPNYSYKRRFPQLISPIFPSVSGNMRCGRSSKSSCENSSETSTDLPVITQSLFRNSVSKFGQFNTEAVLSMCISRETSKSENETVTGSANSHMNSSGKIKEIKEEVLSNFVGDSGELSDISISGKLASLFMALFFYRRWSIVLQKLQRNTDIFKGGKKIQNRFRRLLFSTDSFRIPNSDYRTNILSMLDRNRRMKEILYEIGYENLCSNWILFECESSFPNSAGESKINGIVPVSVFDSQLKENPYIKKSDFGNIEINSNNRTLRLYRKRRCSSLDDDYPEQKFCSSYVSKKERPKRITRLPARFLSDCEDNDNEIERISRKVSSSTVTKKIKGVEEDPPQLQMELEKVIIQPASNDCQMEPIVLIPEGKILGEGYADIHLDGPIAYSENRLENLVSRSCLELEDANIYSTSKNGIYEEIRRKEKENKKAGKYFENKCNGNTSGMDSTIIKDDEDIIILAETTLKNTDIPNMFEMGSISPSLPVEMSKTSISTNRSQSFNKDVIKQGGSMKIPSSSSKLLEYSFSDSIPGCIEQLDSDEAETSRFISELLVRSSQQGANQSHDLFSLEEHNVESSVKSLGILNSNIVRFDSKILKNWTDNAENRRIEKPGSGKSDDLDVATNFHNSQNDDGLSDDVGSQFKQVPSTSKTSYLNQTCIKESLPQTEFEQKKLCLKDDRIDDTKLQDQRDHLIMIREKDYIKATVEVWSAIPLNGSFNNNILSIQGSIKELQNILYSPSTSWNEYFEAKEKLQKLINELLSKLDPDYSSEA